MTNALTSRTHSSARRTAVRITVLTALAIAVACSREQRDGTSEEQGPLAAAGVVDSALPIDTLLRRFRAQIPDTPTTLIGGESSPERVARAVLRALSARDTAAAIALGVNRAEFAWLYYPHSIYTHRPYELGPDLVWMQQRAGTEAGLTRLFNRYGGSRLRFERITCPDSLKQEGPNTIIEGCRVRFAAGDSAARELRLFGGLIRRDGRVKILTYANDL